MPRTSQRNVQKQEQKPDKYWAVEVLTSAVRIAQDAGIGVLFADDEGTLWLGFPGVTVTEKGLSLVSPENDVTPNEAGQGELGAS